MNLFDKTIQTVLKNNPEISDLRIIIEKEILHHEIIKVLSEQGILKKLVLIGGTCLRVCWGNNRFSEDLDFTMKTDVTKEELTTACDIIKNTLCEKYGFKIEISTPKLRKTNVSTWKIKIQTRPEKKLFPRQVIHIDICSSSSYKIIPMPMINHYGIDFGTDAILLNVQSMEEILVDKILAFGLRPNRFQNRDLFDIVQLYKQGNKTLDFSLLHKKLQDREISLKVFLEKLDTRYKLLVTSNEAEKLFKNEMFRFIPSTYVKSIFSQDGYWTFLTYLIGKHKKDIEAGFS